MIILQQSLIEFLDRLVAILFIDSLKLYSYLQIKLLLLIFCMGYQIQKSPVEGLNLLSGLISSTTSNISLSQSVLLLNALSQEAVNVPSTPKFVQVSFKT